jgi:hypothetical protein
MLMDGRCNAAARYDWGKAGRQGYTGKEGGSFADYSGAQQNEEKSSANYAAI